MATGTPRQPARTRCDSRDGGHEGYPAGFLAPEPLPKGEPWKTPPLPYPASPVEGSHGLSTAQLLGIHWHVLSASHGSFIFLHLNLILN